MSLDDLERLTRLDPSGMGQSLEEFPRQWEEARRIAQAAPLPEVQRSIRQVVVCGMGGSGIGGLLVSEFLAPQSPVPVMVNRDYQLPAFVGPDTLVIASSYSGNTEETLSAYREARRRGAVLVAITTGGRLAEFARSEGVPLVPVPAGLMPRAALGYSFVPLLVLLHRLGLIPDPAEQLSETGELLRDQREAFHPRTRESENRAKQLARLLHGKIPLIYGSRGWTGAVAYRWKCQVNENAKNFAFWNLLPELDHNELVGWEAPVELTAQTQVVILRDPDDPEPIRRRVDVTAELMRPRVFGIEEVWAAGQSPLARMFSLVYTGDWASYYLALLNGKDPFPVAVIDRLKAALARS